MQVLTCHKQPYRLIEYLYPIDKPYIGSDQKTNQSHYSNLGMAVAIITEAQF